VNSYPTILAARCRLWLARRAEARRVAADDRNRARALRAATDVLRRKF
jgi:hypothetical protein